MLNKKNYEIDVQTADQMLQNVFAACDREPNSTPFDKIVLRSKQDFRSDNSFIIATLLFLLLTFIAPLFFPPSRIFLSVDSAYGRPLTIEEHSLSNDTFTISLKGASIDLANTYMEGESGTVLYPMSYDRESNTIVFPYEGEEYNIYIFDTYGKCLHLLLAPRH